MRLSTSTLLATAYFTLGATALPNPRPAATYQVVDVGGPSSSIEVPAAETIPSTSTSTLKPATITVTALSSKAGITTTQKATVTIHNTAIPAVPHHTITTSLPPVVTAEPTPSIATETVVVPTTETVYDTAPAPTYATAVQSSSSSSFNSSLIHTYTFKSAFTSYRQWNQTISTALHTSGTAVHARPSTSVPCPDEKEGSSGY